ncbi:ExeA family protein [Methyloversatilis discipulorum]|uniref:ExeA family protein n=1 Tax=Methyloversatilis discipulorum TaxID=1119528 RepID=UPI001A4D786A|nr:AAA family ATPase [Methyloversatilis discipulorum]MBL8468117.1 AAA family ATPase [Methyloversatilis discipulorum]
MYLDHFGLREAPFLITPHADFFFGGANRSALLDALVYALGREEGLVKVSGEVGTGKTMLARVLIGRLPPHLRAIYLADPLMNRGELLAVLADELGCADNAGDSAHRMLRAVQQALVAEFSAGRQIVLLIDEAHAMPADTLEQIRLLSNLESERHKLIKIALFGQPELDALLDRPDMRQLKDRITQHFRLDPLAPDEVATYIDFRMRAAGYRGPAVFERAATARIARDSGGLTRRINVLADKSLLAAFARNAHAVTLADAQRAAADTQTRADLPPSRKAAGSALLLLGAVALLGAGYLLGRSDRVAEPPVAPAPAVHAEAVAATPPATAPAAAPASAGEPVTPPAPAAADPLEALLAASRTWSTTAPGERWFVQLMSVPAGRADHVLDYVRRAGRALDPQQLRAYRTDGAGDAQLAVIYGDFADLRSAQQAVDAMPDWIRGTRPVVRQLRSLRTDAQ